jgi:hypothetical protein
MNVKSQVAFRLFAYIRFDTDTLPSFGLPLFRDEQHNDLIYIQTIDERYNTISGFKPIELPSNKETNLADRPVSIGEELIYIIVDADSTVHAGTANELRNIFQLISDSNSDNYALRLQICELIGDKEQKIQARAEMRNAIAKTVGTRSGELFLHGILRDSLWDTLLRSARNEKIAREIINYRRGVLIRITGEREINIDFGVQLGKLFDQKEKKNIEKLLQSDLDSIDEKSYPTDTPELAVLQESLFLEKLETPSIAQQFQTDGGPSRLFDDFLQLKDIYRNRTQELRIAAFLSIYIEDYEAGKTLLKMYLDRINNKKFELRALLEISSSLFKKAEAKKTLKEPNLFDQNETSNYSARIDREVRVAKLVPKLYTLSFPLSRGRLLWALANRLSNYPIVNSAIEKRIRESRARDVNTIREGAMLLLARNKQVSQ